MKSDQKRSYLSDNELQFILVKIQINHIFRS